MTRNRPPFVSLPTLLLALLIGALSACSSTPTFVPTPAPLIPPLPQEARQPATPSLCLPTCSAALTQEQQNWRGLLTSGVLPGLPASGPTTR